MAPMAHKKFLKIGITGTIISALCCFTPLLVVTFSVLGISSLIGLADYILLPSLAIFAAFTLYALATKAAQ